MHPELQNSKDNEDKNKSNKSNNNNKSKNELTKGVITTLAYNLENLTLSKTIKQIIYPRNLY